MSDEHKTQPAEFQDPLEDYSEPDFADPVEEAIHNTRVPDIHTHPHLCVTADTTVREAMKLMVGRHIACVLVEEDGVLAGVFGDRDVLDKVALEYEDVIDGPVSAVMSRDPVSVGETDSVAKVMSIMAVSGYRHVPVVAPDGHTVGIVSPHRLGEFLREHLSQSP